MQAKNKSEIFRNAWQIAKDSAAKFGGKAVEFLGESLRLAWKGYNEMKAIDLSRQYFAGEEEYLSRDFNEEKIVTRYKSTIITLCADDFLSKPKRGMLHTSKEGLLPRHCFNLKNGLFFYTEDAIRIASNEELEAYEQHKRLSSVVKNIEAEKIEEETKKLLSEKLLAKASASNLKIESYVVELGAIVSAPNFSRHRKYKNWAATVEENPTAPSGLSRKFWKRCYGDRFTYLIPEKIIGSVCEFAAERRKKDRLYCVCVERSEKEIKFVEFEIAHEAVVFSKI